ncbi:DUF2971 domain-containing protein [Flectobacillus roseus]
MKVYKYRGIEKEVFERDFSTFLNNQFFAPKFEMSNDPFEANFSETISNTFELLRNVYSVDVDEMKQRLKQVLEFKDKLGILSLSRTCYSEQMWAYYASSNRGYCIEYDFDKLKDKSQNFDFSSELEIAYDDEIPILGIEDIKSSLLIKKMFGVKKKSWLHEEEIRLIFENSSLKSHHDTAITGIYFGYQTDDSIIQMFKEKFSNRDLKFYRVLPNKQKNILESKIIFETQRQRKFNIESYDFKILKRQENPLVENYYIHLKGQLENGMLKEFVKAFREEYCYKPNNLYIFNTAEIFNLIDLYPLRGLDYVRFANALIATADFEGANSNLIIEFPYKDLYYRELVSSLDRS